MASEVVAAEMKRKGEESSSTTPSLSGINYQVFLNFRSADTRKGFVSHLYDKLENAGIEVFKDDEKLRGGEEISQALKDAIQRSRISIAIFSNDYASAKYCLMELEQMWGCRRSDEHTLIPIFYDVSPDTVKHQTGNFETSFEKHEKEGKVDANTIKKWREVLREVGGLTGYVLADMRDEAALLRKVLKRVEEVLDEGDQYVPDNLVGIGLRVQEMMTKLGVVYGQGEATKVCGDGVRVVGICGLSGVGKTTLVKVVYNKIHKLFDWYSFLEGINSKGVKISPDMLIAELKKGKHDPWGPFGRGIEKLKSLFTNSKVLVVLDDVHEDEQIKELVEDLSWLGEGSRIIVTTDRTDVLKVFHDVAVEEYKVEPMGNYHAHQLFWKHASQGDVTRDVDEYDSLSRDIVKALGGIPMAIVPWANSLRKEKNIEIWRSTRDHIRCNPHERKVEIALNAKYESLYGEVPEAKSSCPAIGKWHQEPHIITIAEGSDSSRIAAYFVKCSVLTVFIKGNAISTAHMAAYCYYEAIFTEKPDKGAIYQNAIYCFLYPVGCSPKPSTATHLFDHDEREDEEEKQDPASMGNVTRTPQT